MQQGFVSFRKVAARAGLHGWCALLVGLVALSLTRPAPAQARYFYLDRAQLSGAPDDGFMVWRPYMGEETRFYGTAALGYSLNPLRASSVTDNDAVADSIDNPIGHQFITYFLIGTQIGKRASFNVSLPIQVLKFTGDDPQPEIGRGGIGDNLVAVHDMRFDLRFRVYETEKLRLGFGGAIWAPTGNSTAFASDRAASSMLFGSGEYQLGTVFIAGMLGPHFRPKGSIGGTEGDLFLASELRYAFGVYYPFKERLRLGLELWGSTGVETVETEGRSEATFFSGKNTSLEWLAQARYTLDKRSRYYFQGGIGTRLAPGYGAPDLRMLASIGTYLTIKDFEPKGRVAGFRAGTEYDPHEPDRDGDGYPDSIDKCPDLKEDGKPPDPEDGCPAGSDRDGDGIPDVEDDCPDEPEDKDGVQDSDGCPEEDADNDKIPDAEDKCPTTPGTKAGQGCPVGIDVDTDGAVRLLEPIQFEFGKATIKPVSFPILDSVLAVLESRSNIRMGVYGHTDNIGSDDANLKLSKDRAAAVMDYLVKKGISKSRLESEGFGESKPVESNNTAAGRAKNRRVEFKILND